MNRILVALDTSEMANLVLERAVSLAEATDAKLHLLRVVPETVEPPVANIFAPGGDVNALVADAESDLLRHEASVPEKHRDGVVVVVGKPADAICKTAKTCGATMVVIGAHRHGILERTLGTTAAKIVNHIDRPVLIVRPVVPVVAKAPESKKPRKSDRPAGTNAATDHSLMEATTLAGATAGAVLGAVGGPPGAIAGGIIGTAVGLLAGRTLDQEAHRAEQRDHELDDEIGVTKGDLGARERASAALTGMQHEARDSVEKHTEERITTLAKMLRVEHQRLEALYDGLLEAYRGGNWEDVRTQWATFEPALRAHMATEEEKIFHAFRAAAPAAADALTAEHAELKRLLETLGVAIELHALPQSDAEELVRRLRAHGEREESLLYPWLEGPHTADILGKLSAA